MEGFTPLSALAGGALIGLAASLFLYANGRIAGISGVYSGLLHPKAGDIAWRMAFVGGLLAAGVIGGLVEPSAIGTADRSVAATAAAGLLVGFGVRMGNGCTSGHGVCGLTRFSRRSFVATLAFMGTGMLTASLVQALRGGAL
ncbi:MAG: YeeE/YedE family protein [Myxococcales bacterium]|nr:YeeE/YedE family protein [Myxococcales bacterium]MCB9671622.1 YeeE/YedE family protein [Alphaproteobacteria bacterium]MCB9693121.1 YeeE/YedE family protein [Alphaproteobacteria bacterium]